MQADPCVSAAVHYTASALYKAQQDYAKFYKSTLHYLAFVSSDSLMNDFKLASHSFPDSETAIVIIGRLANTYMLMNIQTREKPTLGCTRRPVCHVVMSSVFIRPVVRLQSDRQSGKPSTPLLWRCDGLPLLLQALAVDVSLAALLGEGVYNFGELLQHPIVSCPRHHTCCDLGRTCQDF
jgi:hypothetical protein